MSDHTCSIDGCQRSVRARGWCNMHYQRWMRHGSTDHPMAYANAPDGTKWCSRCAAYKSTEAFYKDRRTTSGFQSWCKPCMAAKSIGRKYVLTDTQKVKRREYLRWYRSDPVNMAKHAAVNRRRRVVIRSGDVEPYTSLEIAERDGWRCQICGKRIGRNLRWPHPRSLSIDHIVPVSKGGGDVKSNVQATHLGCNISKSVNGTDQLRLIG